MCGRFVVEPDDEEHFFENFGASLSAELFPRGVVSYNIAPTHDIAALRLIEGERHFTPLHWGLIPSWAKDRSMSSKMINARSETVAEKPSFRKAFAERRCVVPASGWYEWKKPESGKSKTPYYFRRSDGAPLAFASIWEEWIDQASGEVVQSVAMLTQDANKEMAEYHHRMPMVLDREGVEAWLDDGFGEASLVELLSFSRSATFVGHIVNKDVGRVSNNHAGLIKPHVVRDLFS